MRFQLCARGDQVAGVDCERGGEALNVERG